MSIWTHVNGVIRIDGLFGITPEPDCGSTCKYYDNEKVWDKCNVPCGSEGSLQVLKWTNPNNSSLARYTITVFGDLRNYDDEKEIIEYFNRIIKGQMVRQGCFSFYIEGQKRRTFSYDSDKSKFVEHS